MACNGCFTSFSLLRPEKGCPSCGFSYCGKCLVNKIYLPKLKAEHKVCNKCKKATATENKNQCIPPDVFYKRMGEGSRNKAVTPSDTSSQSVDNEIHERLNKLKEKNVESDTKKTTDAEIAERLQKIKQDIPVASDAELHDRLAKLRGIPVIESKPLVLTKDTRSEQEQVEDLMKQYLENTAIDCKYKKEFDSIINDMESRLQNLKGGPNQPGASGSQTVSEPVNEAKEIESENEEESVKKIIEKLKAESLVEEQDIAPSTNDELPFCEICNEDANMRCLGCKYLFCKECFRDHKDDDDGCDKYELYTPPKNSN